MHITLTKKACNIVLQTTPSLIYNPHKHTEAHTPQVEIVGWIVSFPALEKCKSHSLQPQPQQAAQRHKRLGSRDPSLNALRKYWYLMGPAYSQSMRTLPKALGPQGYPRWLMGDVRRFPHPCPRGMNGRILQTEKRTQCLIFLQML